ncbi:MFS transporter [Alcaligenes faecalis]|uniref:MFS transporter n=1 Tax=Alcaligenes faecalis TaxID=511 RepID=UPI000F0B1DFB|nr:MFS transporter [Alcaligenes faecalis]AYR19861.1 MFS transporter [Alcaligenes faecalis]
MLHSSITHQAQTAPLSPSRRWLILAIVSAALLLIVVDMTVLYTALPRLTHDLHASASDKLWIVNSYALVVSGLLLGMGTLGDRLGHKRLFLCGLATFGLASIAAAYSPNPTALIAARAFLGVAAAMMMPATLSLIRITFHDERERAVAFGVWSSIASGGAAFGPVLGGFLLEHFWWGSVFLINVPIVLIALPMGWLLVPRSAPNTSRPWDIKGSLLIMVGLVASTLAIKEMGKLHINWGLVVLALLIGIAFLSWFVRQQNRSPFPLLDFSLFKDATLSTAVLSALTASAALIGMELVFSQRLQLVLGFSPLEAGLAILPLPLAAFVSGPLAGRLLVVIGSKHLLIGSLSLAGTGMAAYLLWHNSAQSLQVTSLVMLGLGVGAAMTAASSTIMQSVPPSRAGMIASVEEMSYELGGALGVTIMGSLLSFVYSTSLILPQELSDRPLAYDSLDQALLMAETMPQNLALTLSELARNSFDKGYVAVLASCTALLVMAALAVWYFQRNKSSHASSAY